MINQLRIYEIFDDTKQAFLDRFRDHAARLMRQHGFRILAMWETRHNDNPVFAYLLSWKSEAEMAAGWERFMADEEWKEIKRRTAPATGSIVDEIIDFPLHPVDFSQALTERP